MDSHQNASILSTQASRCLWVVNLWHFKTRVQLKNFFSEYLCKHQVKEFDLWSWVVSTSRVGNS